MFHARFQPGDLIVFRKQKRSAHPTPRAKQVHPTRFGDDYDYMVDKYWIVDRVLPDGRIVARTRRGKQHELDPADPHLRPARWYHRLFLASRFPDRSPPSQAA